MGYEMEEKAEGFVVYVRVQLSHARSQAAQVGGNYRYFCCTTWNFYTVSMGDDKAYLLRPP